MPLSFANGFLLSMGCSQLWNCHQPQFLLELKRTMVAVYGSVFCTGRQFSDCHGPYMCFSQLPALPEQPDVYTSL